MNHPELIAVPVLMLADYALTILGAKSSAVIYRNHFTTPTYELNPLLRPLNSFRRLRAVPAAAGTPTFGAESRIFDCRQRE